MEPEVRIHGLIATVTTPYDFSDRRQAPTSSSLIKTEEGCKIAGGVYTLESKCDPSPLGPLKQ